MADRDDELDDRMLQRFAREHSHLPVEPFVADTLRGIRGMQQRAVRLRTLTRAAVLLALIVLSPWLIEAVEKLNALLDSSMAWTAALPGAWVLAALAAATVFGLKLLRSR